ncbi:MAG TPA: FHA domain-containing protein [Anaerolineae bacterium]|nr:FHA domain-containing protein [Anaerolineales bacterium]HRV90743.1 FHA domain-containing protein [Anaerolineae bacterium]
MSLRLIESGEQISFGDRTELIVGRLHKDEMPDIDLEPHGGKQLGVSRRHSRILRKDGQWYIEDLDSTNGTFVNGVQILPRQLTAIHPGDYLRLGTMEIQFGAEG